ncbi:MAG: GNAT family N-acetyltransferase [Clostridia bacterium]|nr:GNAT family N-acetyltransferase [Clostridia bacterium]
MVRKAGEQDAQTITRLALKLWPDNDSEELLDEIRTLLHTPDAALFLLIAAGETVGFAQCQLRHDYVEGTDGSPVGYLEGVYVDESHRRKGGARRLLSACEDWARERGCTEFASDCELDNTESLAFHLHAGFSEANRIICFTKKL